MQGSHPASTVMNNGWGQNGLPSNINSAPSWQQPTGMGQQNMGGEYLGGSEGQQSFFQQTGLPSFFQQPEQPPFYRQEPPTTFGHQPPPPFEHQQQRPAWTGYLGNAPAQVCLLNFHCSKLFILLFVGRGRSFSTKADLSMLKGKW